MTEYDFGSLDEFALLPAEAAEFGLPWSGSPAVRRVTSSAGGPRVSALRWGTAPPDVVLLHGAALNAHTWDAFALAAGRPLLAPDLPGHGESAWRDDARYGPEELAPAIAGIIESRAAAPVALVGHSLGGLTAIAVAAARPDLVARLVLVDALPATVDASQVTSFLAGPEVFSSRAEIVVRARAFGIGHSDAAVARGVWHNTRTRPDGSVVWKHHLGNLASRTGRPFHPDFTALWPALESFAGPVLLVRAERGFLDDAAVAEFRARRPGARIADVPGGHNTQENDPALLARIVNEFLAAAPSGQEVPR